MPLRHAEDQELYETLLAKSMLSGQPIRYGGQSFGMGTTTLQRALLAMAIEFDRNRTHHPHSNETFEQDQSVQAPA